MPTVPTDTSGVQLVRPTAVAGAGAGTGPPAPVVSVDSSDERGSLTCGTGTVPAAGTLVSVTFTTPRDPNRLPVIMISETTQAAAGIDLAVIVTATGFSIVHNTRLAAASQPNTTYGVAWVLVD